MKQITLNIPENKYKLFIDFIKSIDYIKTYNELNFEIEKEEQNLILDRIKKTKKTDLKKWDDLKNTFNVE